MSINISKAYAFHSPVIEVATTSAVYNNCDLSSTHPEAIHQIDFLIGTLFEDGTNSYEFGCSFWGGIHWEEDESEGFLKSQETQYSLSQNNWTPIDPVFATWLVYNKHKKKRTGL